MGGQQAEQGVLEVTEVDLDEVFDQSMLEAAPKAGHGREHLHRLAAVP